MSINFEDVANDIKQIPIVFILGHGRSGTTLLQSLLNSHPNIAAPQECDFILHLYPRFGKINHWEKSDIYEFIDSLFLSPLFSIWLVDKKQLTKRLLSIAPYISYQLACKIVIHQAKKSDKQVKLLSDKNPINSLFIKKLLSIFPDAQFIHMVRDPRDSVNGHIKRLQNKNPFFLAWRWKRYNILIERQKRKYPNKFFTIQYENMVGNIEDTLISLSSFIGLPFYNSMMQNTVPKGLLTLQDSKFFEDLPQDKRDALFKRLQATHKSTLSPVNSNNIAKWKNEMNLRDIMITEIIAGKLARNKYGYEEEKIQSISISAFQLLKGRIIYFSWEFYTRLRYSSYKLNRRYKAKMIRTIINK